MSSDFNEYHELCACERNKDAGILWKEYSVVEGVLVGVDISISWIIKNGLNLKGQ